MKGTSFVCDSVEGQHILVGFGFYLHCFSLFVLSFSAMRLFKHWSRRPRAALQSPSLEILKTELEKV